MAQKALELAIKLFVEGQSDIKSLAEGIIRIKDEFGKLQGRTLDDILNGSKANATFDEILRKAKLLVDYKVQLGATPLDLNLNRANSQLDLTVVKGRQLFDLITNAGRTKVDFDLSKANNNLDLAAQKGRTLLDVLVRAGKQKIDFNLDKVTQQAQNATRATGGLGAAVRDLAAKQSAAAAASERHQVAVRALASGYLLFRRALLGLGIIAAVRETLNLVQAFDKARLALQAIFKEDTAAEFEFIKKTADSLGLSITDLATQYARFSAAGKALGISQEIIRDNFLAVAEAGAKLALSSDEVEGALTAIQQIASKGRLSMEELRQQLGDRLPGAVAIAAQALGVTQAKLFALVEAGQVSSEVFLKKFPAALRASFGTDTSTRVETTTAAIERFKNQLKLLIDEAIRAGTLDAFTTVLTDLGNFFKDPGTVAGIKKISSAIGEFVKFVLNNIDAIKSLVISFGTMIVVTKVAVWIDALMRVFGKLGGMIPGLNRGLLGTAAAAKVVAGAATEGAIRTTNFVEAIGSLALAAKNPIVITVAGLAALDAALVTAFINKLDQAREAALKLNEQQRELASSDKLAKMFMAQAAALDDLTNASETVALTTKEINSLSSDGLRIYNQNAEAAKNLADIEAKAVEQQIKGLELRIQAFKDTKDKTDEAIRQAQEWKDQLANAEEALKAIKARSADFAGALDDINKRAAAQDIALDSNVQHLRELAKQLVQNQQEVQKLNKLNLDQLGADVTLLVDGFKNALAAQKGVHDAFKTMIPKDFANASIKQISDFGNALAFLEQESLLTAKQINEQLVPALAKLTGNDLNRFAVQAQNAFEVGTLSAQGLATVLDGQLRAALQHLGLDADDAGSKVSKKFAEMADNLRAVANNVKATGAQIRGALDVTIAAAKTKEELLLVKDTILNLSDAAKKFGSDFEDSLLRLDDKIRLSGATLDSALGDSFERFGIKAKSSLQAIADQAVVDFNRIKDSGQGATLEIENAFRQMVEKLAALNNGIPPVNLRVQMVDNNAFDLLVKSAEVASERVKKAIENAIPLADTLEKLNVLRDGIVEAFDKGSLAADDFGKLMTQIGFKIREEVAKPVGELAASAELLGVKTKDQLQAISDNAEQAFQTIRNSGQFTDQELAKAAQQFLDASIAANNGVADSFDPVVQAAQDAIDKVSGLTDGMDKLKQKALELKGIDTGNLHDKSIQELQQQLTDTIKAYRAIGVQNVQDLQIVQALQQELNNRSAEAAQKMKDAADSMADAANNTLDAASQMGKATTPSSGGAAIPGLGGGVQPTYNFNFNGAALTADDVKRKVIPVIANSTMRRQ